jgi:hypothetical protein
MAWCSVKAQGQLYLYLYVNVFYSEINWTCYVCQHTHNQISFFCDSSSLWTSKQFYIYCFLHTHEHLLSQTETQLNNIAQVKHRIAEDVSQCYVNKFKILTKADSSVHMRQNFISDSDSTNLELVMPFKTNSQSLAAAKSQSVSKIFNGFTNAV